MLIKVVMPVLGETMQEGLILEWHKKEGDWVEKGDPLFSVETDKTIVEVEALESGYLQQIVHPAGSQAPVQEVVAYLSPTPPGEQAGTGTGEAGAGAAPAGGAGGGAGAPDAAAAAPAGGAAAPGQAPGAAPASAAGAAPAASTPAPSPAAAAGAPAATPGAPLKISPAARRLALDKGIDLNQLAGLGTGPGGRIRVEDVEAFLARQQATPAAAPGAAPGPAGLQAPASAAAPPAPAATPAAAPTAPAPTGAAAAGGFVTLPLSRTRQEIARVTRESFGNAPHFYVTRRVEMTAVMARIDEYRKSGRKITVNDVLVKAAAMALKKHPEVNVSYHDDHLRQYHQINIGVAMAMDDGVRIPVVHQADQLSVEQIHGEIQGLRQRMQTGRMRAGDMSGATFTVSNLGMFGVNAFTAVIYPPNAAILAVGAVTEELLIENGTMRVAPCVWLTVSADHRALDGVDVARFLDTLARSLQTPDELFA